jgi:heptosyltransferase-1
MRLLLVKMSSMGDIFHTFPALSDLAEAIPGIEIDWVVEEGFAAVAAWHPAVRRVIPIALRRWMRARDAASWREFQAWRAALQATDYDLVIDAQGLLKSALVTRLARAQRRHGYDRHSAREAIAALGYGQRHAVNVGQHAVMRTRRLCAAALGYEPATDLRFRIREHFPVSRPEPRIVCVIGTSWQSKLWADTHWVELARCAQATGHGVELIWGSPGERALAEQIAADCAGIEYSKERLSIAQVAQRLLTARGVAGLDTGFTHLAGALEVPTVGLFGPTSPDRVGLIGGHTTNLQLSPAMECQPCHKRTCRLLPVDANSSAAPCLARIDAARVWQQLVELMPAQQAASSPA